MLLAPRLWEYRYTTVKPDDDIDVSPFLLMTSDTPRMGAIAGLGFGLPMSRVYAEYFGGALEITGMHGYGSDVFLRLMKLDANADSSFVH